LKTTAAARDKDIAAIKPRVTEDQIEATDVDNGKAYILAVTVVDSKLSIDEGSKRTWELGAIDH
jgi:hypothetical protein